ncbi:hypothetical protein M378DRAFT_394361 [Amanita muscaria Koide BX008]|uniref:Uncharacterized protein n=1 Tax=Amanita muscaria (strain Koide BX008) TaxID=946122 RepID=A0A0C2WKY9_AMAMK|nr:hypothetical protein M378DRAFT_394361 [Amanita muscaria Koide BX008]
MYEREREKITLHLVTNPQKKKKKNCVVVLVVHRGPVISRYGSNSSNHERCPLLVLKPDIEGTGIGIGGIGSSSSVGNSVVTGIGSSTSSVVESSSVVWRV